MIKILKSKAKLIFVILVVSLLAILFFVYSVQNNTNNARFISSSQLERTVNISTLSTAEFVYNGIAHKYKEKKPEEVEFYISYNANVKVGIDIEDISFEIDNINKIVKPILPEIKINIATLDENSISYIPKNPKLSIKEILELCKEDAIKEANESELLKKTAEENLKSVIESLLLPILESNKYSIEW